MLDFYYPYTKDRFSGVLKLEKLIENNNLIIYCNSTGIIQALCPQLSRCDKIYINPLKDLKKLELPNFPNSKPTYLFVFPTYLFKNMVFPKIIEGDMWDNQFDVYELKK